MRKAMIVAALVLVPTFAWGHGDAAWIQNGGYHNAQSIHCCGPADCRNIGQADVHRVEGGWQFEADVNGEMMTLFAPDGNTFSSQDENVWFCIGVTGMQDKVARCLFIPGNS